MCLEPKWLEGVTRAPPPQVEGPKDPGPKSPRKRQGEGRQLIPQYPAVIPMDHPQLHAKTLNGTIDLSQLKIRADMGRSTSAKTNTTLRHFGLE